MKRGKQEVEQDFYYEEEGISLKELFVVLFKGKKIIALTMVIILLITAIGSLIVPNISIGTKGEVQTAIQLYFNGIEEGKNPDGLTYDVNEMKSAEIIKRAIDSMQLSNRSLTAAQVKDSISFQALLPDKVAETLNNIKDLKTEQLKLERLEKLEINPDVYLVKMNVSNHLGISAEEGRELLDNIVREYKSWLVEKYSGKVILSNIFTEDFDLDHYDYIQATEILSQQLTNMEDFTSDHLTEQNFSSAATGLSAADIKDILKSIRSVDVENLYTKIGAFYITKDILKSAAVYEQMAIDKEKEASQRREEAASLMDMIHNFKRNDQTIVMGDAQGTPITITNENEQYNKLAQAYTTAGTKAEIAAADAEYYREEGKRFQNATDILGPETEEAKQVEKEIKALREKLVHWTKMINDTADDYYAEVTYQKYMEQLIPANLYSAGSSVNLPLNLAIGLVAGLILGILIVLFQAYLRDDLMEEKKKEVITDELE